ncbi:MAG TPA: flavin reductase family protein [Candidatus Saccharimonadales bacterium]|nr:flavin reductase family protein [Candidatus Saccharimonadales bacterium]
MVEVTDKIHRILAPRLVVTIGTVNKDGRKNIIPINNITSISTEPSMVLIAVYKPWITAENLKTAKAFTVSVPHRDQLELVWKLGQKYSGYNSGKDKIEEFKDSLDLDFSEHGPVLKDALGWVEYKIIDLPKDVGGNHLMVIGQYTKAKVNPMFYDKEISPIGNPKPFMQWERNNFAEASDIFRIDYFKDPGF